MASRLFGLDAFSAFSYWEISKSPDILITL
jgi:hypothetical protein